MTKTAWSRKDGESRKQGEFPPDHDEFIAWCDKNQDKAWGFFLEWLETSPFRLRPVGEELDTDISYNSSPKKAFSKHLKTIRGSEKLRHWTCRAIHHLTKGRRFYRKEA